MPSSLSRSELTLLLPPFGYKLLVDESYAKATTGWYLQTFYPWFRRGRADLGLTGWTRKHDCDNFARAYCQAAQDCHSLSQENSAEALAVGEFFYYQEKTHSNHAIVCAVTEKGLIHIEPQTGELLFLTASELLSCSYVRF